MAEAFLMVLLAHCDRPERDKFRNLRMDQALTLLPIPWALAATRMSMWTRFFAVLAQGPEATHR